MGRYVALLRGINVGGKNVIKMTELKACFEHAGFADVVTYIQSGNVLFTAGAEGRASLARTIEAVLAVTFDYRASVLLRSRRQMQSVVQRAPEGFGKDPATYRYDVIFLKEPLTAATAMKEVRTKAGVDDARAGQGVVYFSRLIRKASQSQLSKLVSMPVYQSMTIRNWNTTTKLLRLMEGAKR
jgi:uncharacterized protein (DUF1697 family)